LADFRDEPADSFLVCLLMCTREAVSLVQANEIIAKRMNKKQQMRWNRATVQPFLDVRTAVLNDTLEDAFRRRYPGFRPANGDEVVALAA
jgi:hypothetical protein